jgi:hypothetical protein
MGEPPLPIKAANLQSHHYRFTCLRTFDHGFCISLEVRADGTGHLTYKMESGSAGFRTGLLVLAGEMNVSGTDVTEFTDWTSRKGYWTMPRYDTAQGGLDGSTWIIEGVKEGKYQVINRWSPESGTFSYEFGERLLKMAQWTIDPLY